MSSELQWQIVRKYNSFLLRNGTGDRKYFSTEPFNLTKKHSYTSSGLVNRKAIAVVAPPAGETGVVVLVRKPKSYNKPKTSATKVHLKKGARPTTSAIANMAKANNYRADLAKDAVAAASQILRSQRTRAATKE